MGKSFDIDMTEYVPFERVSDSDLQRARIFNKCRMSDTGCWLWTGPTNGKGYGVFYVGTKNRHAHRCSYEVFKGSIPEGLHVLHACDTPLCVNPAHLRAGTHRENMTDRDTRKRRDVRGNQIGTSKLTEQQAREIKSSPHVKPKILAEKYGIRPEHIWRIRTGKSWAHVKPAENVDGD
jgi:hypothetical protein